MYPWDGKNIYFMGFMATGKSRVGRELARLLGWPFYDTDEIIERQAGKSISDIFASDGEETFRKLERKVIRQVAQKREQVIALGGGAVLDEENWNLISQSGVTICLIATVDLLYKRISKKNHRPLMAGRKDDQLRERIISLLSKRQPFYDRAQYKFESRDDVPARQLAREIYTALRDDL